MTAGYPLLTQLQDNPPGVIEVYPHPALIELTGAKRRLPYKLARARAYWAEATPAQRRDLLYQTWKGIVADLERRIDGAETALRLPDPQAETVDLKAYEDTLDAVVCAWVGVCALEGRAVPFGDAASAIWIPVQRATVD
jgi:predicted RNase H-like nuclease